MSNALTVLAVGTVLVALAFLALGDVGGVGVVGFQLTVLGWVVAKVRRDAHQRPPSRWS